MPEGEPYLPPLIQLPEPSDEQKVAFLKSAGWLPAEATGLDFNDPLVKMAVANFQAFHRLLPTGEFGAAERRVMTMPRCALPDVMPAASCVQQWERAYATGEGISCTHESMAFASLSALEVHRAWLEALRLIQAVCGLKMRHVIWTGPGTANIWARALRIDGAGSTLAWSYLPRCGSTKTDALEQRYDTGESWAFSYLVGTMVHELLHACGLDHDNDPSAIMYPMMRSNITSPQPRDIARLVARYGEPTTPPTTPTTPGLPSHVGYKWNGDDSTAVWFPL